MKKKKRLTTPYRSTSRRMAINDYITLDWCRKCSASDLGVVGPLKHVLIPEVQESNPSSPHVQEDANPTECSRDA
jgi:hypothetical protein